MLVEGVRELGEHRRRLEAGEYLRGACPRCGGRVHGHGLRARVLVEGTGDERRHSTVDVQRVICTNEQHCGGVWSLQPAFVARRLWRSWAVVERATQAGRAEEQQAVPARTTRRWQSRLGAAALVLVAALAASGAPHLTALAAEVGLGATRQALVAAWPVEGAAPARRAPAGQRLQGPAAVIHRLEPGVRLM